MEQDTSVEALSKDIDTAEENRKLQTRVHELEEKLRVVETVQENNDGVNEKEENQDPFQNKRTERRLRQRQKKANQ